MKGSSRFKRPTEMELNRFAELIREKRKLSGLTRRDLAFLLRIKYHKIYCLERGRLPRNPSEFIRVMEWLNAESGKASSFFESVQKLLRTYFDLEVPKEMIEKCRPYGVTLNL